MGESAPAAWEPGSTRRRVLVESEDLAERWAIDQELSAAGFDVVSCGGPSTLAGGVCTLHATGSCPAAAGADVIFHRLGPLDPGAAQVLTELKVAYPTTPIVVEIPDPDRARFADLLEGCRLVSMPAQPATMVAALKAAVTVKTERSAAPA